MGIPPFGQKMSLPRSVLKAETSHLWCPWRIVNLECLVAHDSIFVLDATDLLHVWIVRCNS